MPAAEELESAALALERRRAAASPALSGTVRVSVGEWGGGFLARHLDQSSETGLPPTLTLELVESWETANLARRDADLALRHGVPEGGNLYVSKVGVIACAVYRRRDGAAADRAAGRRLGDLPRGAEPFCQRPLGGPAGARDGRECGAARLDIAAAGRRGARRDRRRAAARAFAGDADPVLERMTPPVTELGAEYWVIVHRDLRRAACVRAVIDWIRRSSTSAATSSPARRLSR